MTKSDKSIWSYSLYGDNYESYFKPLIENIKISAENNAIVVLNVLDSDLDRVKQYFKRYLGAICIFSYDSTRHTNYPKVLRFLAPYKIQSNFYFFKDSDSVVTDKEKLIMKEWMNSVNPIALIVRDHPLHIAPIMAGMFGVNRELSIKIANSALGYFTVRKGSHFNLYSYDQDWLARNIYPEIVGDAHVNTSFFYYSGERVKRINREIDGHKFIGAQVYKRVSIGLVPPDPYMNLYGEDLLSLPYFSKLAFLYGKVRPTLYVAYLINKIKKYYFS